MSQHDMNIANQTFPVTRTDLNNALAALASTSLGTTAPASTRAGQLWYDSSNHKLMIRNEADDAWVALFTIDQTNADIEVGDENSAPPAASVIKEIYNTTISVPSSGANLTLSETMANFDYLEFVMAEQDGRSGTRFFTSVRMPVSVIPSSIPSSNQNIGVVNGHPGNALMWVGGSGTTLRVQHHGNERNYLYAILGLKLTV